MSKGEMLRALVKQRLTAAAEDIFGLFERTIAEYEETLCRSKEENERQRRLLDAVFNPQLRLHRAVFPADVQQLLVNKEDVPPEQQNWSPSLDQEDVKVQTQSPHIKEEQEEVWASQEEEQLQGLEEADITKFTFTPLPVKSEDDDEENPQTSQLHQRQTDQMEAEADGEDCGGPEPDRNSHPDTHLTPDTEDCLEPEPVVVGGDDDVWKETREPQSGLHFLKNNACNSFEKPFCCFECGKGFNKNSKLKIHMRSHTGEKPFSCSLCFKRFSQKTGLDHHLQTHTGERPFTCSVCGKTFGQKAYLQKHLKCHTGEKPFNCSHCKKCFSRYEHLQSHMRTHTGEKPYSCNVCNRRFTWRCQLKNHKCGGESSQLHEVWTSQEGEQLQGLEEADITKFTFTPVPVKSEDGEEKPDSQFHERQIERMQTEPYGENSGGPARNCDPNGHLQSNIDDKTGNRFEPKTIVINDTNVRETHLGSNFMKNNRYNSREKPYRCFVCGKQFNKTSHLKIHMRIHTGEKPFSCSLCGKRFTQKIGLDYHLKTHSREKPFSCPFCGKSFGQKAYLQKHLKCHTGEKPYSCSLCDRCFSRHEHLQSHMRTHTGEKPFSCNICDKRFTWRCQLKNHKCDGESSQLHEVWTGPGQENQGPPHIKEEEEEVWASQEGEQLQGLDEADITKFTFTPVPMKSEDDDEEKPQSSQLHLKQTEQIKTEADAENCGGPEPDRNSHPDSFEPHGLASSSFIGQLW